MKERNKATPAVYLFLEQDGKILLARRANTGYQDGNHNVPSGHVEAGELPTQALIREAEEEIGILLAPDDLTLVHVSCRPKHDETADRVDFFFHATNWQGEVANMEPDKCDDLRWFSLSELPEKMTPHVRHAIECMGKGIFFSELGEDFLRQHGVWLL